ncbi:MAG: SGNH/GDSL hydrolase family protein [Actinobacteria bacterium]|nr:SGNH/GDSL hydrolase family protein [Actinomycetota bacterium]
MTRRSLRALAIGCSVVALSACGSSTTADKSTATTSTTAADAPRVLVLGDSNLFESAAEVDAALRTVGTEPTLRGVIGFGVSQLDFWREEIAKVLAPQDVVVVGLGTNDAMNDENVEQFPSRLDTFMELFGDRPVIWITHVDVRPGAPVDAGRTVNEHIRAAAERWPNLTVLDFTEYMDADPAILHADALHFSPHGREVYAQAIAAATSEVLGTLVGTEQR